MAGNRLGFGSLRQEGHGQLFDAAILRAVFGVAEGAPVGDGSRVAKPHAAFSIVPVAGRAEVQAQAGRRLDPPGAHGAVVVLPVGMHQGHGGLVVVGADAGAGAFGNDD